MLLDFFDLMDLIQTLTPRHPVLWFLFMMGLSVCVYLVLSNS